MEQNMFIRILNSEMELATGCTEPGAVAPALRPGLTTGPR